MKFKLSWIPFIPIAILSVILRLYQKLFIDQGIDTGFISTGTAWVIYTCMVVVLFVLLLIFCGVDRKTSPYCKPRRNVPAGFFAIISAALFIFNSGAALGKITTLNFGTIIDSVFGLLGGIAIILMGLSSISGRNIAKKMGLFSIAAPLWCCVKLIVTFVAYSRQSVNAFDMTNLFFMSFMIMALFNLSLIYQESVCKNPVKGTILYGMPAFVVTIVYAVANAVDQITTKGAYVVVDGNGIGSLNEYTLNNVEIIGFVCMAFYLLFMMIELTANAAEKEPTESKSSNANDTVEESHNDEIEKEQLNRSSINHVDITDVEESVNNELDGVDEVIESMEKEDKNPDKYDPLSQEYFDGKSTDVSEEDNMLEQSIADIDRLINEIRSETD